MKHICSEKCLYFEICEDFFTVKNPTICENFEDKSYYLRPKYRIGDHVWTISVSDNDIPTCIEEFVICEIRWDGDEFEYYDSEYFLYEEHTLFSTKEEAEVALNRHSEVL